MNFENFLMLISDEQEIHLIYECYELHGTEDAIGCMLGEDIYKGIVTDIEAAGNILKVWVKEVPGQ